MLSYRGEDAPLAARLHGILVRHGFRVVRYDEDSLAGETPAAGTNRLLKSVNVVVAVLTPRYLQSEWTRLEKRYSEDRGILLPCLMEGHLDSWRALLGSPFCADFVENADLAERGLIVRLNAMIDRQLRRQAIMTLTAVFAATPVAAAIAQIIQTSQGDLVGTMVSGLDVDGSAGRLVGNFLGRTEGVQLVPGREHARSLTTIHPDIFDGYLAWSRVLPFSQCGSVDESTTLIDLAPQARIVLIGGPLTNHLSRAVHKIAKEIVTFAGEDTPLAIYHSSSENSFRWEPSYPSMVTAAPKYRRYVSGAEYDSYEKYFLDKHKLGGSPELMTERDEDGWIHEDLVLLTAAPRSSHAGPRLDITELHGHGARSLADALRKPAFVEELSKALERNGARPGQMPRAYQALYRVPVKHSMARRETIGGEPKLWDVDVSDPSPET